MREFNVTGICLPNKHYMVDISNKVSQVAVMVEKGQYFTINRARQYGKTTIIRQLEAVLLKKGYQVARISFEGVGDTPFENEGNFCQNIIDQISRAIDITNPEYAKAWINDSIKTYKELDVFLNEICKDKKVVLIIDETDKTSNNLVFLRFIGMLRDKYLERGNPKRATFQSVILAGVYDIKNLKLKMIQAGTHQLQDGEKRINSPWNIAASFDIDMSFSPPEIATMLVEYEKDHKTGMDIEAISKEIRAYTNGYPYLVSRICQKIDEELDKDWTISGVQKSAKLILIEQTTLFDDLIKNLENETDMKDLLHRIIIEGDEVHYNFDYPPIRTGLMFGILQKERELVKIHNRIFELRLCNYFISEKELSRNGNSNLLSSESVENGKFNMPLVMKKFLQHYWELYNKASKQFLESECRLLFLTYIKPLINGRGFYHIESETRNRKRMDVIVDFEKEQFIVELKIWKGEQKHEKAHEQLIEYLNSKNKNEGYLLTFDFRKRKAKKPSAKWVRKRKKKFLDCLCV